ncbi:hypothetical protein LC603019_01611 [Lawsonella clevelandensis]|uniref:tRNA nuclease CdiA C-terminal domain-containing protein n=2 Tax=Lawsonella clevelandensis TaxID=1528099 RepID=A0A5E3ZZC0_9ACTN|nr:hypothetical protein LC603019_01611 [Lawsonella clevelandensis]
MGAGFSFTNRLCLHICAVRAVELSRISAGVMETLPRPESAWQETPLEQLERTVTWGVRKINGWDALALAQFLGASGSFERNILQQARKTVFHNTQRSGTRYARIPGPYACPFCLMLASRGAAYLTAESATSKANGERFHDGCHCIAIECLTQDDVPSFIHELEQEWNNTAGQVTTGSADQQRAWTQYLHSSRPYQVRAGHTMKNVMTVRPTPSILQAPGQTHLYKEGKKANYDGQKSLSASFLRDHGMQVDGRSIATKGNRRGKQNWDDNELENARLLESRNIAPVWGCRTISDLDPLQQKTVQAESRKITGKKGVKTPDYIVGDATAELKTLEGLSREKKVDEAILNDLDDGRKQATAVVIDARNYPTPREELAVELENRMQTDKLPAEFLVRGRDGLGDYEIRWP